MLPATDRDATNAVGLRMSETCRVASSGRLRARSGRRPQVGLLAILLLIGLPAAARAGGAAADPCAGTTLDDLLGCSTQLREELTATLGAEGAGAANLAEKTVRLRALAAALGARALEPKNGGRKEELLSAQVLNGEVAKSIEGAAVAEAIGKIPKPLTAILFSPGLERSSFTVRASPGDASRGILVREEEGATAGVLLAAEAPLTYMKLYTTAKGRGGQYLPIGAWFGVQLATSGGQSLDNVELAAGFSFTLISKNRLFKILADGEGEGSANPARILIGVLYGAETQLAAGLEPGDEFGLGQIPPTRKEYSIDYTVGLGFRF